MRRYSRNTEPYQIEENLLRLADLMIQAVFPSRMSLKDFKKLLYAIQHHERKPELKTNKGRPKKFSDELLNEASTKVKTVLLNETNGRISLLRFISTYLPILDYPPDIRTSLNKQEINLAEARSLSRINSKSIGHKYQSKPVEIRKELLAAHLKRKDTQSELHRRVLEKLSTTPKAVAAQVTTQVINLEDRTDEFLELSEYDTTHLLWEEIKGFVYLAREIDMNLINETQIEELLNDIDGIKFKLKKYGTQKEIKVIKF
ncbi:MAG TPA: hypothetical protein PKY82_06155 [Pyrinomonadaceae bacterium]|nr:hypothetical protein [Pyrinomonadaceae bacterium]